MFPTTSAANKSKKIPCLYLQEKTWKYEKQECEIQVTILLFAFQGKERTDNKKCSFHKGETTMGKTLQAYSNK